MSKRETIQRERSADELVQRQVTERRARDRELREAFTSLVQAVRHRYPANPSISLSIIQKQAANSVLLEALRAAEGVLDA